MCCRFQKKVRKNFLSPLTIKIATPFCCTVFQKIHKNPSLLLYITFLPQYYFTVFELFSKKSIAPLPGLFPKQPPVALLLFEKIQKIFSTPLIIKITPLFCNTLFELFSKNFYPYTVDYHFFLAFCITPNATFLKKSPSNADYRKSTPILLHPVLLFLKTSSLHQCISDFFCVLFLYS